MRCPKCGGYYPLLDNQDHQIRCKGRLFISSVDEIKKFDDWAKLKERENIEG